MTEKPILFSGAMVRAILDGRKTMTRRVVKPQPINPVGPNFDGLWSDTIDPVTRYFGCPYGQPGSKLWVRETWALDPDSHPDEAGALYRATDPGWDENKTELKWRPSIHMPRWASRLTLEITGIRVERLQQISAYDAIAEGIPLEEHKCGCEFCAMSSVLCPATKSSLNLAYAQLWDSINAKRGHGWDENPWVWIIEFQKYQKKKAAGSL